MSNTHRTPKSDTHTHTGRRRHAAPRDPNWGRRAGLVGGVVSALALSGAAAPAMADNSHHHHSTAGHRVSSTARGADLTRLTTLATAQQADDALQQSAIDASITAEQQNAAAAARQQAADQHKAAVAKAQAKAKAARAAAAAKAARARAAASRAAQRTPLTPSPAASAPAPSATTVAPASGTKVDRLISFLKSQLGKPYVYGATGPDSYDCSGLTQVAFGTVGVSLPRTSQEQSTVGTPVPVSALQPGDLIFWGGEGSAYHVGVYIGDGQYLDAANPSTPVAVHQLADYMPDWAVRVL